MKQGRKGSSVLNVRNASGNCCESMLVSNFSEVDISL